jgi:hypothetical protein
MPFEKTIQRVETDLISTFDRLDSFFQLSKDMRAFQPAAGEWCIDEILEHITLTNHFLMITLKQSLDKVLKRAQTQAIPEGESDLDRIVHVSDPDAFAWIRPEHMEPTRMVTRDDVKIKLATQRDECLDILTRIQHGEGSLHHVRMSVQDLGKLDLYQRLYFIVQHAKRHVVEMERIQANYVAHNMSSYSE